MPRFLVVLDVDSTLIEQEIIELLAEESGSRAEVASITLDAMNGKLDFEESLRARVATLKGLSVSVFQKVQRSITVTRGVPELVKGVQAAGGRVGALSGGFHELIDPLAAGLGLDRWRANTLEAEGGVLTGRVRGKIIDAKAKAATLESWSRVYGIPLESAVSIGDGANDLAMMRLTGLSVAFDAKAPVRDEAGVILDERDLSRVLPLLGLEG